MLSKNQKKRILEIAIYDQSTVGGSDEKYVIMQEELGLSDSQVREAESFLNSISSEDFDRLVERYEEEGADILRQISSSYIR